MSRRKTLFTCCGSALVTVEHEVGAVAWLAGTLVVPSVQGHGLLCCGSYGSWYCSTVPKFQLAAAAPSKGPESLSRVCMAAARTI